MARTRTTTTIPAVRRLCAIGFALTILAAGCDSPVQTDDPDPELSDSAGQSDDGANPDTGAGSNGFDSDTGDPGDPGDDAARAELGAVAISFRHPAQARTAFPAADVSSVTAFDLSASGPESATATWRGSSATTTLSDLAVGEWTISVDGRNTHGDVVARGSAVVIGTTTEATVALTLAGNGADGGAPPTSSARTWAR